MKIEYVGAFIQGVSNAAFCLFFQNATFVLYIGTSVSRNMCLNSYLAHYKHLCWHGFYLGIAGRLDSGMALEISARLCDPKCNFPLLSLLLFKEKLLNNEKNGFFSFQLRF